MKKQRSVFLMGGLLLAAFTLVTVLVFRQSSADLEANYLASEGSAAENFAVLTAANIHLTDARVKELKEASYSELQASAENKALADMMGNESFATKVDYAYVMVHLKDEEVRYRVTAENQDRLDAPVGTKLDILWLLDVNVSDNAEENVLNDDTSELVRYAYYIEEDEAIFGNKPTYIYNSSEWGDHICGYAPLYSEEGAYIGAVGVELQTVDYNTYCGRAITAMGTLLAVTLVLLSLVFCYLYYHYRQMQMNRIYTDALTGMSNRSYYNDQFIRRMNACRKNKPLFALMIMDVDLFKKVNDTFGHEIGDAVLLEMGSILMRNFDARQVVRFGGEEFVAGLWIDSEEELRHKLDALLEEVRAHKFSNQQLTIGLSVGCTWYKTAGTNGWLLSGMLRAADSKLYECKEGGRDQYRLEAYDPKKDYKI